MLELLLPMGVRNARLFCETAVRTFVPLALKTAEAAILILRNGVPIAKDVARTARYLADKHGFELIMGGRYPFKANGQLR